MEQIKRHSGEAVAVLLSVWLGLAAMQISHIWSIADPVEANLVLLKIGSWWMPNWMKIGSYAGKETVGLIVWLASWLLLFMMLRKRDFHLKPWIYGFIAGIMVVVIFTWPPLIHTIFGWTVY